MSEIFLLENILDALDRLFDSKSKAIDIYALLFATSKALPQSDLINHFNEAITQLEYVLSLNLSEDETREQALNATNNLRIAVADALPFPSIKISP